MTPGGNSVVRKMTVSRNGQRYTATLTIDVVGIFNDMIDGAIEAVDLSAMRGRVHIRTHKHPKTERKRFVRPVVLTTKDKLTRGLQ